MTIYKKGSTKQNSPITLAIIYYFIEQLNGALGKTHLQKMLFLTDLISTKKFKEPLTNLKFQKYHYGPFSNEVDSYIDELKKKKFISVREFPFSADQNRTYIRYYLDKKASSKPYLIEKIGLEKLLLLNEVIQSYGNSSLQEVLDIVYSLETIKQSELCKPIEMAKIIEAEDKKEDLDIF